LLQLIDREVKNAMKGLPARITARMNSLVDDRTIDALYRASQAGVKIELLVRGICCLRPGVKGLSSNISVRSIVDRFLEHSRVWRFENACRPEVFVTSADWMPRNFVRRIEVAFPIDDGRLVDRITSEILALSFADNTRGHVLQSNGLYRQLRQRKGAPARRSQFEFIELASNSPPRPRATHRARPAFVEVRVAPRPPTLTDAPESKVRGNGHA
jgi:polyphosphate kinase